MSNLDLLEAVKNRVCDRCKSSFIIPSSSLSNHYKCQNCNRVGRANDFPEMTIFDRITASPDVLAESVVHTYEMAIGGSMFRVYWTSPFVDNLYLDKSEAIAATVEKLKEVENCKFIHSGERGEDE